jgi:hypothetical protein
LYDELQESLYEFLEAKGWVARVTTFKKYNIACIFCN